jgi:hypothetical protein
VSCSLRTCRRGAVLDGGSPARRRSCGSTAPFPPTVNTLEARESATNCCMSLRGAPTRRSVNRGTDYPKKKTVVWTEHGEDREEAAGQAHHISSMLCRFTSASDRNRRYGRGGVVRLCVSIEIGFVARFVQSGPINHKGLL